nr:hypothetical protein GCM10020063_049320 [Dactylosporangium thailandense]
MWPAPISPILMRSGYPGRTRSPKNRPVPDAFTRNLPIPNDITERPLIPDP